MNCNPMMEQVGRLVGNLLAGGGEVFLPGVGSLYTERRGARRLDRRTVQPPCRVVLFCSQQRGQSLVVLIALAMRDNGSSFGELQAQAQDIYDRWLDRAREGDSLTVEGVGTLNFKNFKPDEAFDLRLNPQGHAPVKITPRRRFDWVLCIGIGAILVAAWFGAHEYMLLNPEEETVVMAQTDGQPAAALVAEPVIELVAADSLLSDSAAVGGAVEELSVQDSAAVATQAEQTAGTVEPLLPEAPAAMVSGRHYVVLGVFSTADNAERAVRDAAAKDAALRCGIYRFGAKFMVSSFEAQEKEPCTEFIRGHADAFPGMWTYTAR